VRNTFLTYILNEDSVRTKIAFANNLDSKYPSLHLLSNYQTKGFPHKSTTIFNKPLPSNVEVYNVSNFIAYCVGHHGILLASEDFYNLSTVLQKL
jgi:hypothetical protein